MDIAIALCARSNQVLFNIFVLPNLLLYHYGIQDKDSNLKISIAFLLRALDPFWWPKVACRPCDSMAAIHNLAVGV
jgi:hypothetical protein